MCKIRHQYKLHESILYIKNNGIYIIFYKMQNTISKGQFAVWYINNEIIGSGKIYRTFI